jgi:hypothetical protein
MHWKQIPDSLTLWRVYPLLGNESINTLPQHKRSKIKWYLHLGNGPVDERSGKQKTMFPVGSVQSGYKKCLAGQ